MMMKNYDESVEINYNPNWSYIPDHPYSILMIGFNVLLNLIEHQWVDIDSIYLYFTFRFESRYQLFSNGREKVRIKALKP